MTDVELTFNSRICGGILVLGAFAGALGLSPMSNLQAALLLLVCVMLTTAVRRGSGLYPFITGSGALGLGSMIGTGLRPEVLGWLG